MLSPPRRGRALRRPLAVAAVCAAASLTLGAALAAPVHAQQAGSTDRVLELVSPPDTDDQSAFPGTGLATDPMILGNGRLASAEFYTALFSQTGNGWGALWTGERTASGWVRTPLEPPLAEQNGIIGYELMAATPDGARTLIRGFPYRAVFNGGSDLPRFRGPTTLWLREADGTRSTIVSIPFPEDDVKAPDVFMGGQSQDLRTGVFSVAARLADDTHDPGPVTGRVAQVYVWRDGRLAVGARDEAGAPMNCGAIVASSDADANAVSRDGRIFYFLGAGQPDGGTCGSPQLWVSIDGETQRVDVPAPGVSSVETLPAFEGMAPDGRTVFLTTARRLTADDSDDAADRHVDLYRVRFPAGGGREIACVTCGPDPAHPADVVPGASALVSRDGSRVWFLTRGRVRGLGEERPVNDPLRNLFVLEGDDVRLVTSRFPGGNLRAQFRLTPDGRHAALSLRDPLVDGLDPQGRSLMYRIAERADRSYEIRCISCAPDGSAPSGDAFVAPRRTTNSPITDDGSTVAFSTSAALTPDAVEGVGNAYEWRDGRLSLVLTGTTPSRPVVFGISGDGVDLHLSAFGALTPEARQPVDHIYDARRGGGFPLPPAPPAPCSGAACQGPGTTPATLPVAATVAFGGEEDSSEVGDERRRVVRLLRARVRGAAVRVNVAVPGRGRVSVAGARVRGVGREVRRAGTYRFAAVLTRRARRALARRGRLRVALRVTYRPAADRASSTARVTVTVRK